MNKIKKIVSNLLVFILLIGFIPTAEINASGFRPATLYKGSYKVVVKSKAQANKLFSLGYKLFTGDILGSQVVSDFSVRLSSSMTSSQTSVPVTSMVTKDSHTLTMADFGGQVYLTIEPGGAKEEIVRCTSISGNVFTSCTRGLAFYGTSTAELAGNAKTHSSGASVIASNVHYVYQGYVDTDTQQTITGKKLFTSPITDLNQVVTKNYVDTRNGYYEAPVANYAALPPGTNNGEMRITLDDSKVYVWNGSAWILAGSGGGAGTIYIDTFMGASSTDRMTFTMSSGSFPEKKYLTVYVNGTLMEEGSNADYIASTSLNSIKFNSAVYDNDKVTLLVQSISYYNPAWGSVDATIKPMVNDSFSLGTNSYRFKDLYTSGTSNLGWDTSIGGSLSVTGTATFSKIPTIPTTIPISAGQVVALDSNAKLPAVDGSQLTKIYEFYTSTSVSAFSDGTPTATTSVPVGAKTAIINAHVTVNGGSEDTYFQITVKKVGITSVTVGDLFLNQPLATGGISFYASWSGDIITIISGDIGNGNNFTATVYYYY